MSSEVSVPPPEKPEGGQAPAHGPSQAPRGHWLLWGFLVLLIVGIIIAAAVRNAQRRSQEPLPEVVKAAPEFTLTDDRGTSFSSQQLAGKPYVIDFIFTRCGGQCPLMTVQMRDLQRWLKEHDFAVNLVSVTVDPEFDTPEVLARYAERFKVEQENWRFLTGPRETVYPMTQKGYLLGVEENQGVPEAEQFIHSDKFVLVDSDGQIRGYYSAQDEQEMLKLRRVILTLMRESKKN